MRPAGGCSPVPRKPLPRGNVLVQAIACGEAGSLADAREVLGRSVKVKRYAPQAGDAWARAREKYRAIEAGGRRWAVGGGR